MAEPMDPTFAALEPQLRELRKAQATDAGMAVARGLAGEMPSRPDYTQERIQLIGMLDNIVALQQKIDAEREKTGRVRLSTVGSLAGALASMSNAATAGKTAVKVASINANAKRLEQLGEAYEKNRLPGAEALGADATRTINELGSLASGGQVSPQNAAEFATKFEEGFNRVKRTTNPEEAAIYVNEVKRQTGVDVEAWLSGNTKGTTAAGLRPLSSGLAADLARADAAYAQRAQVELDLRQQIEDTTRKLSPGSVGVDPGSALGRALLTVNQMVGESLGLAGATTTTAEAAAVEPPPATAKKEEKDAFLAAINPMLSTDATGENVIMRPPTAAAKPGEATPAPAEPQVLGVYKDVARSIAPRAGARSSTGLVAYLDEQRDRVLSELDRLENASDLESVRRRSDILAGPDLAAWAAANGYENYTPEQQLKAAFAMRRAKTISRDKAFRAQLDADILAEKGKAGAIRTAGAAIRTGLRELPGAVAGAVGKAGRAAADLVGGAIGPGERTADAGNTEAEPKVGEAAAPGTEGPAPTAIEAGGIEAATGAAGQKAEEERLGAELTAAKEGGETPREEAGTVRAAKGATKARGEGLVQSVAFADMMANTPEALALRARLARQIGGRAATEATLTEAQREELKRRYVRAGGPVMQDPRFADVRETYAALQRTRNEMPRSYTAGLQQLVGTIEQRLADPQGQVTVFDGADRRDQVAAMAAAGREELDLTPTPRATPPAVSADIDVDYEPDVDVPDPGDEETPVAAPVPEAPVSGEEAPEPEPGFTTPEVPMEETMPEAPAGGGGFLQKLKKQQSGPQGGTAAEAATAQGQGTSAMPQAAPSAPIAFQSFGAEAATDAAMQAQMRRRQLEADRARRLGLMRGEMA